jgi:hypothetical protein
MADVATPKILGVAMRWVLFVVGLLGMVIGVVWTLQGLDVLGGGAMSGNSLWAIVGPVVVVIGLIVAVWGVRRGRTSAR